MESLQIETRPVTLTIGKRQIEAVLSFPQAPPPQFAIILTHGAGGSMNTAWLPTLANHLAMRGFLCLRFTYRHPQVVHRCKVFEQVVEQLLSMSEFSISGIFIGGRSMGSRAAVAVANNSQGTQLQTLIKGVICLSYPLVGAASGDVRDQPLYLLKHPTLFLCGSEDKMCPKDRLEAVIKEMDDNNNNISVVWIRGAGHGLDLKGKTEEETSENISQRVIDWCNKLKEKKT